MKSETEDIVEQQKTSLIKIILIWAALVFVILTIVAIIVGYYFLCALFMPHYITTLILLLVIAFLMKKATYYLLFPGVIYFHRSSLEKKFSLARIRPIVYRLEMIIDLIKCIKKEEKARELKQAKLHVEQACQALGVLSQKQKLTKLQEDIKILFDKFLKCLESTKIKINNSYFSIMSIISYERSIAILQSNCDIAEIVDQQCFEEFSSTTKEIIALLLDIEKSDRKLKKKYKNQTEKVLGTLEFALAEFSVQNHLKRFKIIGKDKNEIHGYANNQKIIVYSKKHYESQEQKTGRVIEEDKTSPTLIYCNGNAGQYEFNYFIDDWSQKIINEYGINMVFWSYRGYGFSTGTPSTENLCKDVECVYDYLKNEEKLGLLGVYGTSLGGLVAAHLGASRKLDFLFVDRSFACVSDIAYYTMFRVFKLVIRFLTNYDLWSPENYYKATCYKVISYDPNDEAIGFMASMMNGISQQVAQNLILGQTKSLFFSQYDYSLRKNFKGFWRRSCTNNRIIDQTTNLYITLAKQKEFYQSLRNLVRAIKTVIKKVKQIQKQQEAKKDQENILQLQIMTSRKKDSTCNIDFEIDEKCLLNNSELNDGDFIIEQVDQIQQTFLNNSQSVLKRIESKDIKIIIDENNSSPIDQQISNLSQNSNIVLTELKKYKYTLPNNLTQLDQIKDITKSIFTLLDQYDSSGLTLLDCINQSYFPRFQMFILNLFVWGSYPPVAQTVADNPQIFDHHRYAKIKTQKFIDKIDYILQKYEMKTISSFENSVIQPFQLKQTNIEIQKETFQLQKKTLNNLTFIQYDIYFNYNYILIIILQSLKKQSTSYFGQRDISKAVLQPKSHNVTMDAPMFNSGLMRKSGENDQLNAYEEKIIKLVIQQQCAVVMLIHTPKTKSQQQETILRMLDSCELFFQEHWIQLVQECLIHVIK